METQGEPTTTPVAAVITDVRIPFWSMVVLLIKLAIAAVPAILFLALAAAAALMFVGGYAALLGN